MCRSAAVTRCPRRGQHLRPQHARWPGLPRRRPRRGGGGGGEGSNETYLQAVNGCADDDLNECGYAASKEYNGINNSVRSYNAFQVTPSTNLWDVVTSFF